MLMDTIKGEKLNIEMFKNVATVERERERERCASSVDNI